MNQGKRNLVILILGVLIILSLGVGRILEIRSNHKLNLQIAEACLDDGGTVVVEEKFLFGLTDVTCE